MTTFREIAKTRGDTTADEVDDKLTLTISGCGLQGTGKTLWGLKTMPTPILHLNFDRVSDGLLYQKDAEGNLLIPKERQQDIVTIHIGPEQFNKEGETSWNELSAGMAREKMEQAIRDYTPALKGGTFFLDGGAMLNQLVQLVELAKIRRTREGKDQKLFPFDYALVNSYINGLMGSLNRADFNFYITHHLTENWDSTGPMGTYRPQHNSQVPKIIEIELWFWCLCSQEVVDTNKKKGVCRKFDCTQAGHSGRLFNTKVIENKMKKSMIGYTQDNLTFDMLYLMTFGQPYKKVEVEEEKAEPAAKEEEPKKMGLPKAKAKKPVGKGK